MPRPSWKISDLTPGELDKHLHSGPVRKAPCLLSTCTRDVIVKHLHQSEDSLPPIHSCDTPNLSDTKTHWASEDLHRVRGCRRFKNYEHLS